MKAWITLLTQPDYLVGVRALHASLKASHSRYPLVVMITDNIDAIACQQLNGKAVFCVTLRQFAPARICHKAMPTRVFQKYGLSWRHGP